MADKLSLEHKDDKSYVALYNVETDNEKFYFGEAINEYLFNSKYSTLNIFYSIFRSTNSSKSLPLISKAIDAFVSSIGKGGHRVWDNCHNPYDEKEELLKIYELVLKHIEPFNVDLQYIPAIYGFVLSGIMEKVKNLFPERLNCYEMMLETIIFYSHMYI